MTEKEFLMQVYNKANNCFNIIAFDYRSFFIEDISSSVEGKAIGNNIFKKALRISNRELTCDFIFTNINEFELTEQAIRKRLINVDFDDRYQCKDLLGWGSSSMVMRILNKKDNKLYAGKFLCKKRIRG